MSVTLSNRELALIGVIVIVVAVGTGIFHDTSIKGVYQSFTSTYSKDANLTSQNQQLQNQMQQLQNQLVALQGLPKVALVHGSISNTRGTSIAIFFDAQSGPSLSSAIIQGSSYPYVATYQAYLGSGLTYGVRISYNGGILSGVQTCAGVPVLVIPTGSDYSQSFTC